MLRRFNTPAERLNVQVFFLKMERAAQREETRAFLVKKGGHLKHIPKPNTKGIR